MKTTIFSIIFTAILVSGCASQQHRNVPVVDLGISDISTLLKSGKVTSEQLVIEYLKRINTYDKPYKNEPGINSIIKINPNAVAEARKMDKERSEGHIRGQLHGIPIVVKDNYDTADMPTTNGSLALKDFQPAYDATQIERLKEAGAIIIAKTNLHEYAAGTTTISSLGGQTRNPYDQTRVPGGSSGGTAAAVSASFAPAGLGTDTCGSIRSPSSFNNLVGLRPTKGLTSIAGVAPLSTTQDVTGPITKTVIDAALLLDVMAGYDPKDPATSLAIGKNNHSYESDLSKTSLKGKRIGLLSSERNLGSLGIEKPTRDIILNAAKELKSLGAEVIDIQLPPNLVELLMHSRTTTFEFRRDLNTYLSQPGATYNKSLAALTVPLDKLTLSDIIKSGEVTPAVMKKIRQYQESPDKPGATDDYKNALNNRVKAAVEMREFFLENKLDAVAYAEIKATPRKIDDPTEPGDNCGLSPYTGFPAINIPAGFDADDKMPVGIEFLGLPFSEATLLSMGYAYEDATKHRIPPKSTPELK